jgi:hypothetical protein
VLSEVRAVGTGAVFHTAELLFATVEPARRLLDTG